jgi:hypothetical protein
MTSSQELRDRLETEFEYLITAEQWASFQRDFPADLAEYEADASVGDQEAALEKLSYVWRGWKKGRGRPAERSGTEGASRTDPRWGALAEILTIRGRRDLDVIDFRRDELGDQLIGLDDIPRWIKQTAEADGPSTRLMPDHETPFRHVSKEFIRYVDTYEMGWVVPQPIRIGGRLWRLRGVARRIAQGFGWPEQWAVPFILTDVPPPRPLVFGWTIHEQPSKISTMDWVELRVNPRAVSPRDLETYYRRLRSEQFGLRRVDSMSEKTAALAVHWEQTMGQSTGRRRAEWNRRHRKWEYTESTGNFGRDARAAHAQATGEGRTSE